MSGEAPARGGSRPAPEDDGGGPESTTDGPDTPQDAAEAATDSPEPVVTAATDAADPVAVAAEADGAERGTADAPGHGEAHSPDAAETRSAAAPGSGGDARSAAEHAPSLPAGATALSVASGVTDTSATHDFPPPEGAGRAASGDAPAPARQWPLISVLSLTALGLLTVGVHPFDAAFRVGTIMVGAALIGGAVLRRVVPSVGMLAVRSRFTDMVTYGVLGVAIVLFALMIQPRPWVAIPFLQSVVHSSVP